MISKRSPSHPFPSIQLIVTYLIFFLYRCKEILMEILEGFSLSPINAGSSFSIYMLLMLFSIASRCYNGSQWSLG